MSFHIMAWVTGGNVTLIQSDTNPITQNFVPDHRSENIISAIAEGDYINAGDLMPMLSVVDDQLTGIDIIEQITAANPNQPE